MKHLLTICLTALATVATADAFAQNSLPAPNVAPQYESTPPPAQPGDVVPPAPQTYPPAPQAYPPGQPIELYDNVKVRRARNIHPCAVPTIVEVPDPCNRHCTVCIEICAPPCECVCVKKHGLLKRKVRFDYGDYKVDVVSRRGRIVVKYDS